MNAEERTQLLRLLEDVEEIFDGTLGDWYKEPVNLEINPYSKPVKYKYYPFTRIKTETFCKELKLLVKI